MQKENKNQARIIEELRNEILTSERRLEKINDTHHVALLRMIKMVVDNAHKEGIWAGICGELGADITLTEEFLRMGLDEVSVSPASVLAVRNKVRNTKLK